MIFQEEVLIFQQLSNFINFQLESYHHSLFVHIYLHNLADVSNQFPQGIPIEPELLISL